MSENKKSVSKNVDELFTNPEPWESWESKLVLWSILAAIIGLVILGFLINWFIL